MSKDYLEALERLAMPDELHIAECKKVGVALTEDYEIIKQALLELKSIKEANLSKAMKGLHTIAFNTQFIAGMNFGDELRAIEHALLKAQELEIENSALLKENSNLYVELTFGQKQYKELIEYTKQQEKALEIIKEKRVNVGTFIHLTKVLKKDYEKCKGLNNTFGANICDCYCEFLTEEEFSLLKEVLG